MSAEFADGFPAGVPGYDSLELLGRGASASVYKARQRSTGQLVAVKVPHAVWPHDPAATRRLHQRLHHETRLCATMHHPHIVRLVDKGLATGGMPYAVFEFVPGETLADLVRRRGALPVEETVALMAQLLDALAWLHAREIMHRDLKPQNIMITHTGTGTHSKVLDFGIASRSRTDDAQAAGEGTPAYCAPEQLRGEAPSPQADLYAWGLLFLECLSGQPVLQGLSAAEARRWQLGPAPVPLPPLLRGHALAPLLRHVVEKDALHRAGDAAALYRDLLPAVPRSGGGQVSSPAEPEPYRYGAAETEDGISPTAFTVEGSLAVLCLGLRLDPAPGTALGLHELNALRQEQIDWSARLLADGGAMAAGTLGDRLLFHYPGKDGSAQHLEHAIRAAADLQARARRRSHLLQLRRGVQLQLCTCIEASTSAASHNRSTNLVLHLASHARGGMVIAGPEAQRALGHRLRFEPFPADGVTAFRLDDVPRGDG